jgi:archaellum component FlaC
VKLTDVIQEHSNILYKELDDKLDEVNFTVDNTDSNVGDINTKMERVEERIEEMAIEVGALHQKDHGISDKIDMTYNFICR